MEAIVSIWDRIFWYGESLFTVFMWGDNRLSRVPVQPHLPLKYFQTPVEPLPLVIYAALVLPHSKRKIRLQHLRTFEANSYSFSSRCLRFMQTLLFTMQDSLTEADLPYRTGLFTCLVARDVSFSIPISRTITAQRLYPTYILIGGFYAPFYKFLVYIKKKWLSLSEWKFKPIRF